MTNVFYNDSNFNRRKDIDSKLLEYKDTPYTAADKTAVKKSLKNLSDAYFSAIIRIGKKEEPEKYKESEILELKQKQNEMNSEISSTIDGVKTFGDLKLLFFIPFAYHNEK